MRALYQTYKVMRVFPGIDHPDGVRRLPGKFVDWALQFDAIEREIDAEQRARMWGAE